jgi:hypothetical protein
MADNLDDIFGDLLSLLQAGGFEIVAMLQLDGGTPEVRDSYHAILVGLEGEVVHEFEVPADQWRGGGPPMTVRMGACMKAGKIVEAAATGKPFFNVVEYDARERCGSGCCVWYHRTTPPWGE